MQYQNMLSSSKWTMVKSECCGCNPSKDINCIKINTEITLDLKNFAMVFLNQARTSAHLVSRN